MRPVKNHDSSTYVKGCSVEGSTGVCTIDRPRSSHNNDVGSRRDNLSGSHDKRRDSARPYPPRVRGRRRRAIEECCTCTAYSRVTRAKAHALVGGAAHVAALVKARCSILLGRAGHGLLAHRQAPAQALQVVVVALCAFGFAGWRRPVRVLARHPGFRRRWHRDKGGGCSQNCAAAGRAGR